jgi:hypothetical protein
MERPRFCLCQAIRLSLPNVLRCEVARRMAGPLSPLRLLSPLGPLTETQTPIRLAAYRRFPDVYP